MGIQQSVNTALGVAGVAVTAVKHEQLKKEQAAEAKTKEATAQAEAQAKKTEAAKQEAAKVEEAKKKQSMLDEQVKQKAQLRAKALALRQQGVSEENIQKITEAEYLGDKVPQLRENGKFVSYNEMKRKLAMNAVYQNQVGKIGQDVEYAKRFLEIKKGRK